MSELDDYEIARMKFKELYDRLVHLNTILQEQNSVEPRKAWANVMLLRLSVIAAGILKLTSNYDDENRGNLEHYILYRSSLATLGKVLIEAALMFVYVSALDIPDDEWKLRMNVLELYDVTARLRLNDRLNEIDVGEADDASELQERKAALKRLVSEAPLFSALDAKRREKILDGSEAFITGARSVVRELGQDVGYFDAIWTMMSTFEHGHPSSFFRSKAPFWERAPSRSELTHNLLHMDIVFTCCASWLEAACDHAILSHPELRLHSVK